MTSNRLPILQTEIRAAHEAALGAAQTAVERARDAGIRLLEAKGLLGHGEWLPWLKETGVSPRTAQKYGRLARHNSDISAVAAHLTIDAALDAIAAPCEPPMISRYREAEAAYDEVLAAIGSLHEIATASDAARACERLSDACSAATKAYGEASECFGQWVDDSKLEEITNSASLNKHMDWIEEVLRLTDVLATKRRGFVIIPNPTDQNP